MRRENAKRAMESAPRFEAASSEGYHLRLFVTGATPQSTRAITNIRELCETHLRGRYTLEIFDLYQQPSLAKEEGIVAVPTLIVKSPMSRRLVGDLSNKNRLLLGLGLQGEGRPGR